MELSEWGDAVQELSLGEGKVLRIDYDTRCAPGWSGLYNDRFPVWMWTQHPWFPRGCITIDSPCECEHNIPDSLDARLVSSVVLAVAPAVAMDQASSLSLRISRLPIHLPPTVCLTLSRYRSYRWERDKCWESTRILGAPLDDLGLTRRRLTGRGGG